MKHLHDLHLAEKGDFLVDRTYTFEIGGTRKTSKQIQGIKDCFLVRDDIEVRSLNIIPFYLFFIGNSS